jgi:Sulfotransferase family
MVISDSARLLFVHVQKTGGSTIHNRLTDVLPDARRCDGLDRHATLGQMLRKEPELHSYWTFGMVRNPWARMLSWYRMIERFRDTPHKSGGWKVDRRNKFMRDAAKSCPDFEAFVLHGMDKFSRLRTPQAQYLTTKVRRADLVGRQETLEADLRAVFARFELPWEPLDSVNIDRKRPTYRTPERQTSLGQEDYRYRSDYTDEMRRRVETAFARDIELFGYSF